MKRFISAICSFALLLALGATHLMADDTTRPITTATPLGGTYTGPISVTLAANEPARIYYTTNGSTPTTSSPQYVSPISITSSKTLKYFARDTASNSESVKSQTYTINAVAKVHDAANTSLTWTGYGMCKDCHSTQARDMYQGVHYQWKGSASKMTTGPAIQGKVEAIDGSSAMNAYCINVQGSWTPCGACHVGTGAKPVSTTTPDAIQLGSIDCLMCHRNPTLAAAYSRVRNATTGLFEPAVTVDMNQVVRTVVKPTRTNCLQCHAKAGGGDAVKRGDLALASGITADANYDVHMATSRGNFACQKCHTFTAHRVAGRGSDLRPLDSPTALTCSSSNCHPTKNSLTSGHASTDTSHHISRVACQTCHLPKYAKDATDVAPTASNPMELTETHRTWESSEWNATLNRYEPVPTKAGDLIPKYQFWNGTSWGSNAFDTAVVDPATGNFKISRPVGTISGPAGTKLYPFKYKTARQPLANGKLVTLKTATFFSNGVYDTAVQDGLAYMGMAGAPYTTVTTDEYQVLNHQIPTKADVLTCSACHPNVSATRMKLITNYGYALKAPASTVCTQCHGMESIPDYQSLHSKHVTSERFDCSFCHTFSRATERSLSLVKHN